MEEHDGLSEGISSIPKFDFKIEDENPKGGGLDERGNPILNSDIEKANEMSLVSKVSQISAKEGKKVVDCEKGAFVKRCDSECVTHQRSELDLNVDATTSCFNEDSSSVCFSSSMDVCGSSTVEKDPMELWKSMKQNGFLSNPQGGVSLKSSSSRLVSSSCGGIPVQKKRGRKSKKNSETAMLKRIEIARKEEVDRFAKLAAPIGLLNDLNPGIIHHVRNKKQVLSIIQNIVRDSGNFHHPSTRPAVGSSMKNMEDVNTDASTSDFNQGFKNAMPGDNYSMGYYDERCADGKTSEENASSMSSQDTADLNSHGVLTVKAATVASQWLELLHQDFKARVSALRRSKKRVRAVITTELPFLIRKEFPANKENDPNLLLDGASRASTVDIHKTRWMAKFNQLEQTLSEEERKLESWLNQVRELQSHCDHGLQNLTLSSGQNYSQLGMPLDSRAADALKSDKDLVVSATAASIFSTCNFLASRRT